MAFPVVAAVAASTTDTDATSHVVSLPTGITAGNLLICFLAGDGSGSWALDVPAGWTAGYADENNSGGCNGSVRWKIADGTEGSTVTFTSSASEKASHRSMRITGAHATTPFTATGGGVAGSQGTSATPDPPSHTPSYGAADSLWIVMYAIDDARSATAYPTNYADNQFTQLSGGSSGRCGLGLATRNLNATVDDPAAFTVDTSDVWLSATIAIQPAAAGDIVKTLGVATVTNVAQVLGKTQAAISKSKAPGLETDAAQALAFTQQAISASITPAGETGAAQALGFVQAAIDKALGVALETGEAQLLSFTISGGDILVSITPAIETGTAQTLASSQTPITVVFTPATEADTAQGLAFSKAAISVTLTPASEIDAAVALAIEGTIVAVLRQRTLMGAGV